MKVYQTDVKGFFVGEIEAKKDQFGDWLIPAGCVQIKPPAVTQNKAAQFINGAWALVDDLVGVEYWHEGKQHKITERGESLPEGATLSEPAELVAAREAIAAEAKIKAELLEIDIKSIRALREYVASKADAPQYIKDHEAAAKTARGKIK